MDPLQNAKSADCKTVKLLHGYIHDIESNIKLTEIASLIFNIILGFYYHSEFVAKFLGDHFRVSEDKLTVTNIAHIGTDRHTIYFNQWLESISESIVTWTFKINHIVSKGNVYFGLTTEDAAAYRDFAEQTDDSYCIDGYGRIYYGAEREDNIESFAIEDNDALIFTLDLGAETWSVMRNNGVNQKITGIKVSDDIKYKFVIQLGSLGDCVTLSGFEVKCN